MRAATKPITTINMIATIEYWIVSPSPPRMTGRFCQTTLITLYYLTLVFCRKCPIQVKF